MIAPTQLWTTRLNMNLRYLSALCIRPFDHGHQLTLVYNTYPAHKYLYMQMRCVSTWHSFNTIFLYESESPHVTGLLVLPA